MKVFVTGATGAIGRPTVPLLTAAGHEVTAVVRSPEKRAQVETAGAAGVEVDLFDAAAVRQAVAGHDAVVNLVTNIPPMTQAGRPSAWATNDRLRREASAHLVDGAIAAGAARLVQESIVFSYPDSGERWIDAESTPPEPSPTVRSALVAEAQAQRFTDAGGTGVVLRFGMFYGPGLAHTEALLRLARRGLAYAGGRPGAYRSSIHVDDAAAAVVAALAVPAGTYDVVDDEPLTSAEYADVLAAAVGRRRYVRGPGRLMRLGGSTAEPLVRSQRVSNRRFRSVAGWSPRWASVADGLPAVVGPAPVG
ncbi:MAG: NAD(P)-dependent oxidoreductase [Acidimicrobiales bacterium]|nr:NAD(P)-dependent oxidoreductase [Acidimicrobiales bacterium]